jgi:hypothetical protein
MNGYDEGTQVLKNDSQGMNESQTNNSTESPKRYRFT